MASNKEFKALLKSGQDMWKESQNRKDQMFGDVPSGKYKARLRKATCKVSSTGKPMISREHVILDGEYEGRVVFDNLMLHHPVSLAFVRQWFEVLGVDEPDDISEIDGVVAAIAAAAPTVAIRVQRSEGEDGFTNIYVDKLLETTEGADDDNDDDDDDDGLDTGDGGDDDEGEGDKEEDDDDDEGGDDDEGEEEEIEVDEDLLGLKRAKLISIINTENLVLDADVNPAKDDLDTLRAAITVAREELANEPEDDEFAGMNRKQLKAYCIENDLDINPTKASDDDMRKVAREFAASGAAGDDEDKNEGVTSEQLAIVCKDYGMNEDEDWANVDQDDVDSIKAFMQEFPLADTEFEDEDAAILKAAGLL